MIGTSPLDQPMFIWNETTIAELRQCRVRCLSTKDTVRFFADKYQRKFTVGMIVGAVHRHITHGAKNERLR